MFSRMTITGSTGTYSGNIKKLQQFVTVEYIHDTDGLLSQKDSPVDRGKEVFQKLYDKRFKYS